MSDFGLRLPVDFLKTFGDQVLALGAITPESFGGYREALREAARDAAELYADYLLGDPIPGHVALKKPAELFGQIICRPAEGASFTWVIGHDDDKARQIEYGTPEYDMKKSIANSAKARRSARTGALYLIIPFRHGSNEDGKGTRGFRPMPKAVYKVAKMLAFSRHLAPATNPRLSATGHFVTAYRYDWGGRLPAGLGPRLLSSNGLYQHKTDLYAGMVRFKDNATPNGNRSGGYITFRVMSQNSPPGSWIRPAIPGHYALETAFKVALESNDAAMRAALESDLSALLP